VAPLYDVWILSFRQGARPVEGLVETFGIEEASARAIEQTVPRAVKRGVLLSDAQEMMAALQALGAEVELRPERASSRPPPGGGRLSLPVPKTSTPLEGSGVVLPNPSPTAPPIELEDVGRAAADTRSSVLAAAVSTRPPARAPSERPAARSSQRPISQRPVSQRPSAAPPSARRRSLDASALAASAIVLTVSAGAVVARAWSGDESIFHGTAGIVGAVIDGTAIYLGLVSGGALVQTLREGLQR
jgi:hypothetical protein